MRRPYPLVLAAALLATTAAAAQTSPERQSREAERNLDAQLRHDKQATEHQLAHSQVLNQKAQDNLANLQALAAQPLINPGLAPGGPIPYASSSAAARGQARIGSAANASATVPDMVGGPLNLPGPTDPRVRDFSAANEPAPNAPASTTPVMP